jgi:hypothetical protein
VGHAGQAFITPELAVDAASQDFHVRSSVIFAALSAPLFLRMTRI